MFINILKKKKNEKSTSASRDFWELTWLVAHSLESPAGTVRPPAARNCPCLPPRRSSRSGAQRGRTSFCGQITARITPENQSAVRQDANMGYSLIPLARFGTGIRVSLEHAVLKGRSADECESCQKVEKLQPAESALHGQTSRTVSSQCVISSEAPRMIRVCAATTSTAPTSPVRMEDCTSRFGTPSKLTDAPPHRSPHPTVSLQHPKQSFGLHLDN